MYTKPGKKKKIVHDTVWGVVAYILKNLTRILRVPRETADAYAIILLDDYSFSYYQ